MLAPVARDKATDLLPVSEASFEELRSDNAKLRASDAYLEGSNRQSNAVLEAAEAKILQIFPVNPTYLAQLLAMFLYLASLSTSMYVNVQACGMLMNQPVQGTPGTDGVDATNAVRVRHLTTPI